jgi:hypothetical protein
MAINSAQGIASLYRGNPQPLQQSIQKDQQAKPGLPPDLQKMLALQIVTNETDSVTAQKAMDQLKQMGGQQGKPPTVMASLQQQAEQKLKAQAVQAQQKQQGIQALMQNAPASGVPEGTPEPEAQPQAQGIDQLPVEFEGAEGGIVAFEGGGEIEQEIRDLMAARERYAQSRSDTSGIDQAIATLQKKAQAEASRPSEAEYAREMQAAGMDRPVQVTGMPKPRPPAPMAMDNQSAAETARLQRQKTLPQAPAPTPVRDLKTLAASRVPAPAPVAALKLEAPVAAPTFAAPVEDSDAMKLQKARLNASPEAKRAADVAEYKKMVGEPDTAQHDRLIAELEKRKKSLEPKQGYEGLMEYLSQISANSKPGRGSFASGAAGARGVDQLNKERQLQQFELSKQAIEVSQKKLDTVRAYAKDVYGVGKAAFDQVYKDQFDAAKEIVKDESAARQLAQQNTLKMLELKQQADLRREEMKKDLQVANINASSRTGAGGGDKQQLAELKALQTSLKDQLKDPAMMGKAGASIRAQLAQVNAAVAQMAGLDTMGAAPGAGRPGGIPPDVQALLNKYGGK